MKAKIKFDQAKAKEFFINHTEKIVFGAFAVVFLLFAYSAISKKPYDKTPQVFNEKAAKVESDIQTAQPPKIDLPQPPTAPPPVQSVAYSLAIPFSQPAIEMRVRRKEPTYLTVADLRVGSGFGAIALVQQEVPLADAPQPGAPPAALGPGALKGPAGGLAGKGMQMPGFGGDNVSPKGKGRTAKGGGKGVMGPNTGKGREGMEGMEEGGGHFGPAGGKFGPGGGRFRPPLPGQLEGPMGPGMQPAPGAAPLAESEQFVLLTAPAGSKVEGRQWAVITGLVPDLKQAAEYRRCFANAIMQNPETDVPYYTGFRIQRAEVKPGTTEDKLAWQDIDMKKVYLDINEWVQYPIELVDPMYVGSIEVCHPLPALVGKNFDDSVGHPKIPMAPKEDLGGGGFMGGGMGGGHFGGPGGDLETPGRGAMGSRMGGMGMSGGKSGMGMNMGGIGGKSGMGMNMGGGAKPGMGMNMGGGLGSGMRPRMGGPGGYGQGGTVHSGGGMGDRFGEGKMGGQFGPGGNRFGPGGGRFGGNRIGPGAMEEGNQGMMAYEPPKIEYHLFRFFDFKVVPGKTYRYRVQLELANPNLGYLPHTLDAKNPGLAKGETRTSDWSAPSPEIVIPREGHLLAGKVTERKNPKEQMVEVLVRNWLPKQAVVALHVKNVMRGEVVNFSEEAVIMDPITGMPTKEPKVDFRTNSVLVDIAGGEKLDAGTSKPTAPVEILVMGPDGDLSVGSQVADADEFDRGVKEIQRRKDAAAQPDPNAPAPGYTEGPMETTPKKGPPKKGPFGSGR